MDNNLQFLSEFTNDYSLTTIDYHLPDVKGRTSHIIRGDMCDLSREDHLYNKYIYIFLTLLMIIIFGLSRAVKSEASLPPIPI